VASIFTASVPEGALVKLAEGVQTTRHLCKGVGIVVKSYKFKDYEPLDYIVSDVVWEDGKITKGVLSSTLVILREEEQ